MKKFFLTVSVALASVVAFAQTPKFAVVNFTELVQLAPEADDARAAIQSATLAAQETDQEMIEEYNSKANTYQQKASTWTPAIRESKEKELQEIMQRIQEFESNIQLELQQQQQILMAPIVEKAQKAVAQVAKEGSYTIVVETGSFLYIDESQTTDITMACREIMGIPDSRTLETLQAELAAQAAAQQ